MKAWADLSGPERFAREKALGCVVRRAVGPRVRGQCHGCGEWGDITHEVDAGRGHRSYCASCSAEPGETP